LDQFVETVLIPKYTKGVQRSRNREYHNLMERAHNHLRKGSVSTAQELRKQAQRLPSQDPNDPNFRRLRYCRYADDWLIGFIGPRSEAEEIKQQLGTFLREELKLELSKAKTLITHARSKAARFLGYEVTILQDDTRRQQNADRRSINGRVGLRIPRAILEEKVKCYQKSGKATHRTVLVNNTDFSIIATYQLEFRGLAEYYRLAYNLHSLNGLKWVMERSLTKTLAHKHKMSVPKVYDKFRAELVVNGIPYKGLQVTIAREGKKPLVATWGGVTLQWDIKADLEEQPQRIWAKRSELEQRLLAQVCEQCGATRLTDQIEVHHIRALKDLNKYAGREKPEWVRVMAARHRKTLVLCRTCHQDVHHGRPMRRHVSRA
jgi:hypothetical protein